jgi:hypothetical protein
LNSRLKSNEEEEEEPVTGNHLRGNLLVRWQPETTVKGLGCGFMAGVSGSRVQSPGFRVQVSMFRVEG